jgi:hypothetical protein
VILCPFRAMTGWACPLCGSTRATVALVTGHPADAFHLNALYVALLPVVVYAVVAWWLSRRGRRPLPRVRVGPAGATALLVVSATFAVVRNVPAFHAWSSLPR